MFGKKNDNPIMLNVGMLRQVRAMPKSVAPPALLLERIKEIRIATAPAYALALFV